MTSHHIKLSALLWDVDGTLAETELYGHLPAFNQAFQEAGLPWRWTEQEYAHLLDITGGKERIHAYVQEINPALAASPDWPTLRDKLYQRKTHHYTEYVDTGAIALRPGVLHLIQQAHEAGCKQAIVTTTATANVTALLSCNIGPHWRDYFSSVVCGEDVAQKKPHPEAYRKALRELALPAEQCLAIEDSRNGFAAAGGAGLACLITRGHFSQHDVFDGAFAVCPQLPTQVSFAALAHDFSSPS